MSQASSPRPSVRRKAGGCLLRGALILVILGIALGTTGAILQSTASAADLERFPPDGQMIDLGGISPAPELHGCRYR